MIPKIIHYVWVGPRPLPELDRERVEAWRKLMPDWDFRFWGNREIDFSSRYLAEAFAMRAWNRVSDYVRSAALFRYGGIYLDTDVEILRSLEPLRNCEAFLGFQDGGERLDELVNGAVFGTRPGHWLPATILGYFDTELRGWQDVGAFSGPGLITRLLRDRGLEGYSSTPVDIDGTTVFPREYFYPYAWNEPASMARITDETFAIHHWAATWVKPPSLRKRMRELLLRTFCRTAPGMALHAAKIHAGFKPWDIPQGK